MPILTLRDFVASVADGLGEATDRQDDVGTGLCLQVSGAELEIPAQLRFVPAADAGYLKMTLPSSRVPPVSRLSRLRLSFESKTP